MNLLRTVSLLALASTALSASAQITVYTSLAEWQAAVGTAPTTLETFDTDASGPLLVFPSFTIETTTVNDPELETTGGEMRALVNLEAPRSYTVTPTSPSFAFGGDFTRANSSEGFFYELFSGTTSLGTVSMSVNTGFFGFTSGQAFTSFRLIGNGDGSASTGEGFRVDNVRFATSSAPSVPGPLAALPFALIALRRRKRA